MATNDKETIATFADRCFHLMGLPEGDTPDNREVVWNTVKFMLFVAVPAVILLVGMTYVGTER